MADVEQQPVVSSQPQAGVPSEPVPISLEPENKQSSMLSPERVRRSQYQSPGSNKSGITITEEPQALHSLIYESPRRASAALIKESHKGVYCELCSKTVESGQDLFEGACRSCSEQTQFCRRCNQNTPSILHKGLRSCYFCRSHELNQQNKKNKVSILDSQLIAFSIVTLFFFITIIVMIVE